MNRSLVTIVPRGVIDHVVWNPVNLACCATNVMSIWQVSYQGNYQLLSNLKNLGQTSTRIEHIDEQDPIFIRISQIFLQKQLILPAVLGCVCSKVPSSRQRHK